MSRRRRPYQNSGRVLLVCGVVSIGLHLGVALPLREPLEAWLSAAGPSQPARVSMRTVSSATWQERMARAEAVRAERRSSDRPSVAKEKPKEKPPEPESKLTGQVVEVPPTADDRPNPKAKYLAKYNSRVDRETVARPDARDPRRGQVTHKLQTKERPGPDPGGVPTTGLTVAGGGGQGGAADASPKAGEGAGEMVLEVPTLRRRDRIKLKLADLPGLSVGNDTGTQALQGNSDRLRLKLGGKGGGEGAESGKREALPGLPTLSALATAPGLRSRVSGSPSRDHVEGLPEGEGTFLNTKEFKYATFFYRVRDSVASYWEDLAAQEYRRRDPTGTIYGVRDRSTVLQIRLDRSGGLAAVQVESSSQVGFLDDVAVRAFQMAEPFPNPPPGIMDEDGHIRFNFQFVVTMGRRRGAFR